MERCNADFFDGFNVTVYTTDPEFGKHCKNHARILENR